MLAFLHGRNRRNASGNFINRKEYFSLAILTIIAALIRFWKLSLWSFWADEVFTVQDALDNSYLSSINPLIYFFVRSSINIFGVSEWSARFSPCIIGILTIPAFYFPIRAMFDAKTATIAVIFILLSPWHLFWSQTARGYSLAFLFSGLSAFTFFIALEKDNLKFVVIALTMTILSILSHVLSILLVPAMFVYAVLLYLAPIEKPAGLRWKNIGIFFGPFLLAALMFLIPKYFHYLVSGWGHNQWSRSPIYILFTLTYGIGIPTAAFILLIIFDAGLRFYKNQRDIDKRYLFLLCYAGVPLGICLIFSSFLNIAGYYLFFTAPAYFALAAWGCGFLIDTMPQRKLLSIAAIAMIAATFISQDYLYFQFENGGRAKWREALNTVKDSMKPEDKVIVAIPRFAEYYLPGATIIRVEDVMSDISKFEREWNTKTENVWIIVNERSFQVIDRDLKFRNWVYSTSRLVAEYPLYARLMNRTISVYKYLP
ncbi:MAG: glycosyltransferase family 39 protein [Candidatus Poribacteria bacterium]